MNHLKSALAGAIALTAVTTTGFAQVIDPSRLAEGARPLSVPTLLDDPDPADIGLEDDNPFAEATPGDDDLGQQLILKETPKLRWLSFLADTFGYFTDNPANLSIGSEDDYFWGARVSLGAQPRIADRLYADAFLSQQVYRYDRFEFLDYEYFEGSLGLIYIAPRLRNSTLFVQAHYSRMTNDNFGTELYDSWSVRAGVQKSFIFDRRNSIHANIMGDWDFDNSAANLDRFEYIADLAYNFKLMRDLIFALSYRFTWFDYQEVDRTDYLNLFGASLSWSPKKWLDVYAAVNFSDNQSDLDIFNYQAVNAGGGLGVRIRF